MKAAILGTTGYTGQILLRLLSTHPEVTHIYPVSSSSSGTPLMELDPSLGNSVREKTSCTNHCYVDLSTAAKAGIDIVFAALPHLASAEICKPFFQTSVVVDLSADFRISDPNIFFRAYNQQPPRPDLLNKAVYGLSEWMTPEISQADLIANPGCYPTATLLPLLPLIRENMVETDIIVNALSGISGAGKKARENLLFCTRTENVNAYNPGRQHRHTQEIQQEIDRWSPGQNNTQPARVYFTPHLVPIQQGMAVTTSLGLKKGITDEAIHQAFLDCYENRPWIRYTSTIPQTSHVRGTNRCDFTYHRDEDRIFLLSVIDNLYKGASGQAVQNMNIRFGFEETLGLPDHGEL